MRLFTVLAIFAVMIAACSQNKTPKEFALQHSDQSFTLVKTENGEKPEVGNYSIFSILIKGDNDKVLLDRTKEESYAKFKIHGDTSQLSQSSPVDEMLTMLAAGDSAVLVYELDSLERSNPAVAGMNSITYEVSVKEILDEEAMDKRNEELKKEQDAALAVAKEKETEVADIVADYLQSYKDKTLEGIQATESGLQYVFVTEGTGPKPEANDMVFVHYYGVLESDGTMFDNSYKRGQEFSFPIGQERVIKGWDEALPLMPKGSSAVFFIPYELAYGAAGRPPMIPEKANLVFFIEYPE